MGAGMILQSETRRHGTETLARETENMELSADSLFMKLYFENIIF